MINFTLQMLLKQGFLKLTSLLGVGQDSHKPQERFDITNCTTRSFKHFVFTSCEQQCVCLQLSNMLVCNCCSAEIATRSRGFDL